MCHSFCPGGGGGQDLHGGGLHPGWGLPPGDCWEDPTPRDTWDTTGYGKQAGFASYWNVYSCLIFYHSIICFSMLADKLNMTPEDAERWIVNLIRNARLDAKIDSKLVS